MTKPQLKKEARNARLLRAMGRLLKVSRENIPDRIESLQSDLAKAKKERMRLITALENNPLIF